tara:strand:- start:234 stop:770 length:537 start_codon:yes stop_codon:yes gene_type:complete
MTSAPLKVKDTTFPELIPTSISFDQGRPNISEYNAFGAGPIRFRHSLFISNQSLQLEYVGLSEANVQKIRDHYEEVGGTFGAFTAPLAIWGGAGVAQSDSEYRYAETPTEVHTGLYFNLTVRLRLLQGTFIKFILDGGPAVLPAEEAFSEFVFDGVAPFILDGSNSATATLVLNATGS